MNISRLTSFIIIAAGIMAAVSCKKDKTTEVDPSLSGTLSFYAPEFIEPGDTITMIPQGVEHPEKKNVGFYWKVTPSDGGSDTTRFEDGLGKDGKESDGTIHYPFPDTLAVFTVKCFAFAEGYTGSSATRYVTTVKPGLDGSLTNLGIQSSDPHITIDGQKYFYSKIGNLEWFRNNIGVRTGGAPYNNADIMSDVLGRFYNYEDALAACPEGWRLPTEADWNALGEAAGAKAKTYGTMKGIAAKLMADAKFNGVDMWDYWPAVGTLTNDYGFSAVPAGYLNLGPKAETGGYPQADSKGVYEYATFWTADQVEGEEGMAYYRYIVADQPDVFISKGDKANFGASVRCVRDAE